MSIALEAKVAELAGKVSVLEDKAACYSTALSLAQDMGFESVAQVFFAFRDALKRVEALEQRGKPGPKPKDSNG